MKKQIVLLVGIVIFFAGCLASSTNSGAVGADRSQLMIVSSEKMRSQAAKSYREVIEKAKKQNALNVNKKQTQRVRGIAKRLIPHVSVFRQDALNWKWEVNVLQSNTLNAWCMPGGKIAFYSGIINKLNLTDDEIAAIMGHEISHALKEHGRERASQDTIKNVGMVAASILGVNEGVLKLANVAATYGLLMPFSRAQESEADKMGVELAARAGFDPYAAVNVWKKMKKLSKSQPLEIMSTHPSHDTRIEDLKKTSKVVYPFYLKSKK